MRRLLGFILCCVVLSSCKKDDKGCSYTASTVVVPASEMADLQTFINTYHPAAILHPGGFYYEINAAGTGTVTPTLCSYVAVKYAGCLSNGVKFTSPAEENVGATYALGQLIVGWQRGLPLIKAGGSINLYLPPSLGYGANATGSIPPNSMLIFVIQMTDVQ